MKKLIFTSITLLFLPSCFQKNHNIESVEIIGSVGYSDKPYSELLICLEEPFGYDSYLFRFEFTTTDGSRFNFEQNEFASNYGDNEEEKCFNLNCNNFITKSNMRNAPEKVDKIKRGNIKKLKVEIWDSNGDELISNKTFKDL